MINNSYIWRRNISFPKFLVALLVLSSLSFGLRKEQSHIKVMTYNIWNGFDWGKDTTRKIQWIKWIQDQNPDVLALQELCGYTEAQLLQDAEQWGHRYVALLKTEGYPVGLTSRNPIVIKERVIDGLWHGMLHCETYGIDFFVVHLSPAECEFRFKEANIIKQKVLDSHSNRFVILGDFNAHSPFDEDLMKNNQDLLNKYLKHPLNLRQNEFDYSVMSTFLSIPSIDVTRKFLDIQNRYTFPSRVLIGLYRKDIKAAEATRERIDYILTSLEMSSLCTNVKVFNTGQTQRFSDHFPVFAEFDL